MHILRQFMNRKKFDKIKPKRIKCLIVKALTLGINEKEAYELNDWLKTQK